MPRTLAIAVIATLAATPVVADSVSEGLRVARDQCADCHVVELDQVSTGAEGAPGFDEVALSEHNMQSLRVFLRTPHATMPNIVLTDAERDAVAAYIVNLRPAD